MKIINASKVEKVTWYARKNGYQCEEIYHLGDVEEPVILSDHTDPTGEIANTLVINNVPVLYLAFFAPVNLSSKVKILEGMTVQWKDIEQWIQDALSLTSSKKSTATLAVKKTLSIIGVQPGVGAHTTARGLAFLSAKHRKTLYIDLNYRYPKAPYIIGLKDKKYTLDMYLESLLNEQEQTDILQFCNHKAKMEQMEHISKQQKKYFKTLPDQLYVLAADVEKGMEYFPEINLDIEKLTDLCKGMLDNAKLYFDSIIVSMSSDIDDVLNLAMLRATDNKFFVTDLNPSSVLSMPNRMESLRACGIYMEDAKLVLNKVPTEMSVEKIEEILHRKVDFILPYDEEMIFSLSRLEHQGGEAFQKKILDLEQQFFEGKHRKEVSKRLPGLKALFSAVK